MKALLLSAGKGTRLRPVTDNLPKVMLDLAGKPCLERVIENLASQGISEFAINTSYLPKIIREYFGDGSKFGVRINYSFEPEILGTSGALNNFRDYFKERFLVVYADVVANFKVSKILDIHEKEDSLMTIALDGDRDPTGKGIALTKGNKVLSFVEKPSQKVLNGLINSGFYLCEPDVLELIPSGFSDFGKDILPGLAARKSISWYKHNGYIFDIGSLEDLRKAGEHFKTLDKT